jgi:hypothetical protein
VSSSDRLRGYRLRVAALLFMTSLTSRGEAIAAQLSLTWADSSIDEAGFAIERSTEIAGTFTEIAETGPGVTGYVDATVADDTNYCYRVRAFNTAAYSDYSNMACGATAQALGLTVVKMGPGSGTVISTPSGIICGATCSGAFPGGTPVTLTATAATGSTFSGWSGGGCTGLGPCTVTMSATTITVTFTQQSRPRPAERPARPAL